MDRSGEDFSKMLGDLMADEKFGEILSAVKSTLASDEKTTSADAEVSSADAESASAQPQKSESASTAAGPLSIPQLPPELITKLPQIMSMLGTGDKKSADSRMAHRKNLLCALKPFLSDRRKEAVESILNIAGIADLFGL